ncbi:uncharacterized protein B0H64DRAFT_82536 [Chaetomium fimeti]|uniref:Uncharacterized protein n=1 Tax=Chaetomium fimeti TaxID=1854472 RepID=A0AAE0HNC4_9PEZI|nr:hypothetical protein B0H64DRAFT_82536 [Chaetomium fimeti]
MSTLVTEAKQEFRLPTMASEDPERGMVLGGGHQQGSNATEGFTQNSKGQWVEGFLDQAGEENERRKELEHQLYNCLDDTRNEDIRLVKALGTDVDVNAPYGEFGQSFIHIVVKEGLATKLRLLLEHPRLEVDLQDNQGWTALHLAAIGGRVPCIELLLYAGANTEVADRQGHLARHYAQHHDHEQQRRDMTHLFDNPRRPASHKLGGSFAVSATGLRRSATQPPSMPSAEGRMNRNLAECLEGSFWEPEGDLKWERKSVWNLIYSDHAEDVERRRKKKKWFHLPAASQIWAHDLVKSIYHDSGKPDPEAQRVCKFIHNVFKEVDIQGQPREYYFKRETQTRRYVGDREAVAVVFPVIDIDRKEYVELSRKIQKTETESKVSSVPKQDLLDLDASMWLPTLERDHITRMLQLCMYHDQTVPRTLDQSYHGTSVDPARLEALDRDQVFTKYLTMLKDVKYKQGSQGTIAGLGPDEFAVVPYFWLFKLDEGVLNQQDIHSRDIDILTLFT